MNQVLMKYWYKFMLVGFCNVLGHVQHKAQIFLPN